jgi:hypothetical protein
MIYLLKENATSFDVLILRRFQTTGLRYRRRTDANLAATGLLHVFVRTQFGLNPNLDLSSPLFGISTSNLNYNDVQKRGVV